MMRALLALILLLPVASGYAASSGQSVFDFLALDVGGKPMGMGGAFTGLADDINAMFYNPAGLGGIKGIQATLFHRRWLADTSYSYLGVAGPVAGLGSFGGSILQMGGPAIDSYDVEGTRIGTINPRETVVALSWGRAFLPGFLAGATVKYAQEGLAVSSISAVLADVSALVDITERVRAGFLVGNLGAPEDGSAPLTLRGGVSVSLLGQRLLGITEMTMVGKDDPQLMLGAEYRVVQMLALRAGYMMEVGGRELGGMAGLTAGAGFCLGPLSLDYAFTPMGELGNAHLLGLTYRGADMARKAKVEEPKPVTEVAPAIEPAPAQVVLPAAEVAPAKVPAPAKDATPEKGATPAKASALPSAPKPAKAPAPLPAEKLPVK